MDQDTAKIQSLRQRQSALFARANLIIDGRRENEAICDATARLFAVELAQEARSIVERSRGQIAIHGVSTTTSRSEAHLAVAERLCVLAGEMLAHAEDCLDNERTIDGRRIHHGPLYYK